MKHTIGRASVVAALIIALLVTHEVAHAAPLPQSSGPSYTIRRGDTLSQIARDNGISISELMRANGLSESLIYPGQQLYLPSSGESSGGSRGSSRVDSRSSASGSSGGFHTVQAGESLSNIAARYGLSSQSLRRANGLSGDRIYVGQTLVVPSGGRQTYLPVGSSSSTSNRRSGGSSASSGGCAGSYQVQRGDHLRQIAEGCGTTVDAIISANSMSSSSLYRGQVIVIPGSD